MGKRVKMVIDGSVVSMLTTAPKEHVEKVNKIINETIDGLKKRNMSLNSLNVYRYTMIALADELIEMKELVDIDGLKKDVSDNELLELRKQSKVLEEDNEELKKRIKSLQGLLTEQNATIEELKKK